MEVTEDVLVDLSDAPPSHENKPPTPPPAEPLILQPSSAEVNEITQNLSISHISSASEINGDQGNWENVKMPTVSIAAIDNGLAFPFKHPDEWRAYPYRWATLPNARLPFSEETVEKILPLLDDTDFVRELGNDLKRIFEVSKFENHLNIKILYFRPTAVLIKSFLQNNFRLCEGKFLIYVKLYGLVNLQLSWL